MPIDYTKLVNLEDAKVGMNTEHAMIASNYSSASTYAVGAYAYYAGTLYKCTTAITTAEAWNSAHWAEAKLGNDLISQSEKIEEVGFVNYLLWNDGYFDNNGNVIQPSGNAEKYTENYIPVLSNEKLTLTIEFNSANAQWARWIFYDSTKRSFAYDAYPQKWEKTATISIACPQNACYLRISFRTFNDIASFELKRNVSIIENLSNFEAKTVRKTGDFISVCHQGYSETDATGHNLLAGYSLAKEKGFDWAECDLKKTSDNILVCCHEASFEDQTTHETIIISEHTLAELQTYNYYGGTIATFEDVVKECKLNGIELAIDQIGNDIRFDVFPIVKKYAMQKQVAYVLQDNLSYPDLISAIYESIHSQDPYATIFVIAQPENLNHAITFCNTIKTANNTVTLYLNYALYQYTELPTIQQSLNSDINIGVWTIDYIPTYKQYLPYVCAITSNKISSAYIFT